MALDLIIDVAEIDDLGFRVAAEEPRAHAAQQARPPSRAFAVWAGGLMSIAMLGAFGRLFEPAPALAPDRPVVAEQRTSQRPAADGQVDGAEAHSLFRYPASDETVMAVRLGRIPGLNDSIAWLGVGVRIAGPSGVVVVKLVSGRTTFEALTVPHTRADDPTASPFRELELALRFPVDATPSDLWILARAYVDGHVVAVDSVPVDPTWPQVGPDKYVIDDAFVAAPTWSQPAAGALYSVRKAARVGGLGWQVDPYAR